MKRRDRSTYIGSTDIAAISGESPWRTPWQVWDAKRNGEPAPPADAWWTSSPAWYGDLGNTAISEAAWWGQASERANLDAYCRFTGTVVAPIDGPIEHPEHSMLASSPDAVVHKDTDAVIHGAGPSPIVGCVECKETTVDQWRDRWDEGRTIPDEIFLQCQWHMGCSGADWCDISVRTTGRGGKLQTPIRVERDDKAISDLVAVAVDFWQRHVIAGEPPAAGAHDLAALTVRAPQGPPPIPAQVDPHLRAVLDSYQRDRALLADLAEQCDGLKALLVEELVRLGATDAYFHGDGDEKAAFTYRPQTSSRPNVGLIREAHDAHNPPPKRRTPKAVPEQLAGFTAEQIATAVAVLDAVAEQTTTHVFRIPTTRSKQA